MSKINTKAVKDQVVNMMGDLKEIVTLYMSTDREIATVEGNTILAREYKDGQISAIRERIAGNARTKFDSLQAHFEGLLEALRENDNIYEFLDPEFSSCIALLSAAEKPLPLETVLGIAGKFLGNRQALLALVEVAKGPNKDTLNKMIFNTESEAERLQDRLIELDINFPKSILMVPAFKEDILNIANACGENLTEEEKDLGADYQEIVTMQMRAAMGLPN